MVTGMTNAIDELVVWLRAQLDEDDRIAIEAADDSDPQGMGNDWFVYRGDVRVEELPDPDTTAMVATGGTPAMAEHIVRHDPDRVRREVAAKRRILDEIVDEANGLDMSVDLDRRVGIRDEKVEPYVGDQLVKLMAMPFAGREGYREEWRV